MECGISENRGDCEGHETDGGGEMSEEEEYCIWQAWVGQMDTSKDWGKLFNLVQKNDGYYNNSILHIIPTRFVGTKGYETISELRTKSSRMVREALGEN